MPTRAVVSLTITRPGGSAIAVTGLRAAKLSYTLETVGAGAVLASSVPYASAAAGLVGWSVSSRATP